ncbi:MAG: hypothetical protein P8M73_13080 [Luminiphilus sp.]|nr:hypothetical protein [Luminiphilus sp.]
MRQTGFSHVVIITAYAAVLGDFFKALGWSSETQSVDELCATFWGVKASESGLTRWVSPEAACEVLLFSESIDAPMLRPPECPVTTPGGLFDINMRTADSDWARAFLLEHGWRELVPSVAWRFGEIETKEGLFIQDDGIVLAVMERLHPPLVDVQFDRMSSIFNSTQMVSSVEGTLAFLELAGFQRFIDHLGPLPGEGPKVLQLEDHPPDTAGIHLSIAHPQASMSGSIELINVPQHPLPPLQVPTTGGRGLRSLCIPIGSIEDCYARWLSSPWSGQVLNQLAHRDLPGVLGTHGFSVIAPDGGRLDLYQCSE